MAPTTMPAATTTATSTADHAFSFDRASRHFASDIFMVVFLALFFVGCMVCILCTDAGRKFVAARSTRRREAADAEKATAAAAADPNHHHRRGSDDSRAPIAAGLPRIDGLSTSSSAAASTVEKDPTRFNMVDRVLEPLPAAVVRN